METIKHLLVYLTHIIILAYRRMLPKSYFRAATAANSNTGFLRLPRELRDLIYEHATCDVCISVEPTREDITARRHQVMWLRGTTDPTLLLVCQQIRSEYAEVVLPKSRLCIELGHESLSNPFRLTLKPTVTSRTLCHVKRLEITLHWIMVFSIGNERVQHWTNALINGQQLPTCWSPARVLRRHLDRLLDVLGSMLHPSAAVTIQFRLDGFPDPADPYDARYYGTTLEDARICQVTFDIDTLFGMESDCLRPWPQRLKIEGLVREPLYSGLAENSAAVMAYRVAWERGESNHLLRPKSTASKTMTVWSLRPCKSEGNWKGFWPTFVGTEDEAIQANVSGVAVAGISDAA
ncbi:hypothetical protein LTS10_009648 [Elasticomyces elasticus]|nr:hypothetical protein LTS10_009648 [Elasticomyces elasticus]